MKQVVAIGVAVLAGAALIEAALIPGLLIGGAAVLAPRILPKTMPGLLRRSKPRARAERGGRPAAGRALVKRQTSLPPKFAVGQAIAKTITFRIIVTSLDFTANYIVLGELATAAGLSSFNLIAGPLFYFTHEAVWNYLGHPESGVEMPLVTPAEETVQEVRLAGVTVSRALAKTISFRTIATVVDFTTNYVVVGNVSQAAILSATGFVLGPFVYYGHEKAWEYFGERSAGAEGPKLLAVPAS